MSDATNTTSNEGRAENARLQAEVARWQKQWHKENNRSIDADIAACAERDRLQAEIDACHTEIDRLTAALGQLRRKSHPRGCRFPHPCHGCELDKIIAAALTPDPPAAEGQCDCGEPGLPDVPGHLAGCGRSRPTPTEPEARDAGETKGGDAHETSTKGVCVATGAAHPTHADAEKSWWAYWAKREKDTAELVRALRDIEDATEDPYARGRATAALAKWRGKEGE